MKKFLVVLSVIGICLGIVYYHSIAKISYEGKRFIEQGDTIAAIMPSDLSFLQEMYWKYILRQHTDVTQNLYNGMYTFTGSYSVQDFLTHVSQGPGNEYVSVTILEGRSIYDTDEALARKDSVNPGDYIAAVSDQSWKDFDESITAFLPPSIKNLEGYLYPDTYFLDINQPLIPQLVRSQLRAYRDKVHLPLGDLITDGIKRINDRGVSMTPYQFLTLASIIEKEEKNHTNQSRIGGLFINRLESGMRIDADISLCYGFFAPYSTCTVDRIVENLRDTSNPYNTRAVGGLPPTPIANPSAETINRLAQRETNEYVYYLHDTQGRIYFGKTVEEHNLNKSKHLSQ